MCTYNRWGQITGYYYGINGVPVVKREGAHTGYVYNPAVNGGAAMYPQTFDTLRMRLSSITGETRGYLYDYRYNTYFDTPISITAIARQGYHFLHWVDSHGVIVCEGRYLRSTCWFFWCVGRDHLLCHLHRRPRRYDQVSGFRS